jgi:hypothetical protein
MTVLLLIAGWYLILPLIVWHKLPRGAAWETESFDPARHTRAAQQSEYLRANVGPLEADGFRQVADLVHTGSMSTTRLALLVHPDGIVGTVALFATTTGERIPMVEFTTVLMSGTVIDVNNTPSLPIFAKRADHVVHRFPSVRDPTRLFKVCRLLLQRDVPSGSIRQPDTDDPVRYLREATEREYRRQVDTGYYRIGARTGSYMTTLKGAYAMAWKLMFPIKPIRKALLDAKARRTLRQLGLDSEGR